MLRTVSNVDVSYSYIVGIGMSFNPQHLSNDNVGPTDFVCLNLLDRVAEHVEGAGDFVGGAD